jgi:hypothetical protein
MLRSVAFVRTDVSEDLSVSFIRVTRIGELGTTQAVTSNRRTRRNTKEELSSSETSVLTRATWRNIPEDRIRHSHRRENLKSYCAFNFTSVSRGNDDSSCNFHENFALYIDTIRHRNEPNIRLQRVNHFIKGTPDKMADAVRKI